jgi:hypothetical protein
MSVPAVPEDASDLAAHEPELRAALTRFIDHHLHELNAALAEIDARVSNTAPLGQNATYDELRTSYRLLADNIRFSVRVLNQALTDPVSLDPERPVEQVSWFDFTTAIGQDEAAARTLWERVKTYAREELASGWRAADAVERLHRDPLDRARFLALRAALADGLQPHNGMEWLLIDQMAQALTLQLHWLSTHVITEGLDAEGLRRDTETYGQWQPPRLRHVEAVDRAAQMADRFQRQFLRLMKCFRDGRRLIASMTVLGGQVNVAEQQVVLRTANLPETSERPANQT